jgi:hypothetical protein
MGRKPIMIGYAHAERDEQARSRLIVPVGAGTEREGDSCNLAGKRADLPGSICQLKSKPLETLCFSIKIHFCRKTFICCVDRRSGVALYTGHRDGAAAGGAALLRFIGTLGVLADESIGDDGMSFWV